MPFRIPAAVRAALAALLALVMLLPIAAVPALAVDTTVRITDGGLDPMKLVVAPGTTVVWVNDAGDRHRMRSESGPTEFDSDNLEPGESFSVTFRREGTWSYVDHRNDDDSSYWGTIVVREGAKDEATPRPADPSNPGKPAPAPEAITMAGREFRPASITVDAGTTVKWRNNDDREHTVTSTDRAFDSGDLHPGQSYATKLTTAGTYRYLCAIHPDMTGSITVRGGSGGGGGGGAAATPTPKAPPKPTPKPTAAPGSDSVTVVDFDFRPGTIDVAAGTTVIWSNDGVAPHTVTAKDGSWDSGMVAAGDAFRRTFTTAGSYAYLCSFHPDMTGTVRVSGSGSGGGGGDGAAAGGPTPDPEPTGEPASAIPSASATATPTPSPTAEVAADPSAGSGGERATTVDAAAASQSSTDSQLRFALVAALCAGAILVFAKLLGSSLRRA
jgi:plastocyanin